MKKKKGYYQTSFKAADFEFTDIELERPSEVYKVMLTKVWGFWNDLGEQIEIVLTSETLKQCNEELCKHNQQ